MRILVAPDKFKGSLGSREVAENISIGLRDVLLDATIEIIPVADGGEGTAEVIGHARGGEWMSCDSRDAIGRPIRAGYIWLHESSTAVMEISEAAGLWRLSACEQDPLRATTHGVGEMLLDAVGRGASEVIIGLGGSATNDGGLGMARALGYRFFDRNNGELTNGPMDLENLARIVGDVETLLRSAQTKGQSTSKQRRFAEAPLHLIAATDVRNPLLGEHGATRTFGPQKGATPDQVELLERGLTNLAGAVTRDLGVDFRDCAGSGAAGGLGFGLMSFCGATIQSGFDLVSKMLDLESAIQRADIVITGEGKLDQQTLDGKAPAGVARLAQKGGKRVFAIVGTAGECRATVGLFDGVLPLARAPIGVEEAMSRAGELLQERGRELGRLLLSSCS